MASHTYSVLGQLVSVFQAGTIIHANASPDSGELVICYAYFTANTIEKYRPGPPGEKLH